MNSPTLTSTLNGLGDHAASALRSRLGSLIHTSAIVEWQKEAALLSLFSRYSAPVHFLSLRFAQKSTRRETFWILCFLFLWQEEGHLCHPLEE